MPSLAVLGRSSASGITIKIPKTAQICFFQWPEVAAPSPAVLQPGMVPARLRRGRQLALARARRLLRWERRAGIPSSCTTGLPTPNRAAARKALLITAALSCTAHPDGSRLPLDYLFPPTPRERDGRGSGERRPCWCPGVSPRDAGKAGQPAAAGYDQEKPMSRAKPSAITTPRRQQAPGNLFLTLLINHTLIGQLNQLMDPS